MVAFLGWERGGSSKARLIEASSDLPQEALRLKDFSHTACDSEFRVTDSSFQLSGITLNPPVWNKHVKITLKYIVYQIKHRNSLCENNIAYVLIAML